MFAKISNEVFDGCVVGKKKSGTHLVIVMGWYDFGGGVSITFR